MDEDDLSSWTYEQLESFKAWIGSQAFNPELTGYGIGNLFVKMESVNRELEKRGRRG